MTNSWKISLKTIVKTNILWKSSLMIFEETERKLFSKNISCWINLNSHWINGDRGNLNQTLKMSVLHILKYQLVVKLIGQKKKLTKSQRMLKENWMNWTKTSNNCWIWSRKLIREVNGGNLFLKILKTMPLSSQFTIFLNNTENIS